MVPPASVPFLRRGQPAMKRRLRWTQVDEQEHATSPETPASGEAVRDVVTSRGAGWAVAAAMAGAVVGLSVAMATSSSPTIVAPGRAAGPRGTPAGPARAVVPAALRAVSPGGRVQAQPPARLRIPASGRLQVLPGGATARPLRVVPGPHPAALVPAAPARLRIAFRNGKPVPVRLLIPAGRARLRIQLPARARIQVPARIQIPVRARIQVPARARITPARPAPPSW